MIDHPRIHARPAAVADIDSTVDYLLRHSPDAARRFPAAFQESLNANRTNARNGQSEAVSIEEAARTPFVADPRLQRLSHLLHGARRLPTILKNRV